MKPICLFLLILTFFGCRKRLDSFLFNSSKITEYKLDDYDGEVTLQLGDEYTIDPGKIDVFSLPMSFGGEDFSLGAIYVGDQSKFATDTIILYCHGNRDHMDFYWPRQKMYANIGHKNRFGVLSIDYPGFGLSTGKPTEENMYASVQTAIQWLKDKGVTNSRLILMGFSLGSAPVCALSARKNNPLEPSKIILEAPFASAEVMIQDASVLNFPASYFVDLKIDNGVVIKDIQQPLLWIHGIDDHFLSIKTHGEVVFANHPGKKYAYRVAGGDHEDTPTYMGYTNYQKAILDFIVE